MNAHTDTSATPRTLDEYLEQVRAALAGADPAVVQDALYDAEEHVRSELAEHRGMDEADVIAKVASSYGSPEEVAAIYRDTEVRVTRALRTPPAPPRRSAFGTFFGVATDPHTYGALFYLLLSLATGIFYFTVAVTGTSLSLGLAVLVIGVPFVVLFLGTVRVLSLVEGRIVEAMLGVRMPRRPPYTDRSLPLLARIKDMFTDPRTWSTLLYLVLMLPLGIAYFTLAITGLAVSLSFAVGGFAGVLFGVGILDIDVVGYTPPLWTAPLISIGGVLLFFVVLHAVRGLGRLHGQVAKNLLVKAG
jgi:uncharacterized membrane protein